MHLIDCENQQQGDAILDIFNDAILHTTALYEYQPRDRQTIDRWFADKQQLNLPVIGALDEHGQLMGFASYGRFRPFPAFNTTVEHSIYLHPDYRGRGIGKVLLLALIERAQSQQYHCMIGAIDADNAASIALHQALGFQETGRLPQVGYKFDRWLDLVFYQKQLEA
ncbi:GNAT family N-acetyltransferase [Nitrincola iocasae]|uniref:N-acetyltransferase family protein n=1 Tax=Nitrincola iocasae TaxID=2614693 RepID=A0A5J6LCU0_9GAMM|nr:GNAT family N-acetyltransferase [Nitrincola iocasae]QEW06042.1 N-acetyltransferase family protein [Nitrincola iocasae]